MAIPLSDLEMKRFLNRMGCTARNTATSELWYHRTWTHGLPLGMAYLELKAAIKRQQVRMKEMQALQRAGFRYHKAERAWYRPNANPKVFLSRTAAYATLQDASA
jgi:hypothetical protein